MINEYKGQLHCHSTESDGVDTPTALVTAYRTAGYDFVSITDHDVLTADPNVSGILHINGVEETATEGHIINTGATASRWPTAAAQDIIDEIIADGAIPIMAHPNQVMVPWSDADLESISRYYAIEVETYTLNAENKWDTLLTKYIRAFGTAVDDCHDISSPYGFNVGWVIVLADSLTLANIMNSLKQGNFYASSGPTLSASVAAKTITATTDSSSTIAWIGDSGSSLQSTATVTTDTYTIIGDEIYIRIKTTRDSDSKNAWSNPIYVYPNRKIGFL